MQKWEYLVVNLVKSYGMNYRANGNRMAEWKDLPIHDVFMRVGQQGYEFAAYDGANYIFKRPSVPRPAQAGAPAAQASAPSTGTSQMNPRPSPSQLTPRPSNPSTGESGLRPLSPSSPKAE